MSTFKLVMASLGCAYIALMLVFFISYNWKEFLGEIVQFALFCGFLAFLVWSIYTIGERLFVL